MFPRAIALALLASLFSDAVWAQPGEKYPLGDDLRILSADTQSPEYHKLVEGMNGPDLDAEWRRVETRDNADRFLRDHGGKEKVLADAELKAAYERRLKIRDDYLALMRSNYRRQKRPAPFDAGQQAEAGGVKTGAKISAERLSLVYPSPGSETHWPRFRGPTGQGNTLDSSKYSWPLRWSKNEGIVWKAEIPGDGNSSPVIWGNKLFLTSSGPEGKQRAIHCLQLESGALLWTFTLPEHAIEPQVREKNGFASSTPVVDGERVIVYFGSGGLVCCDFAGKHLWTHETPNFSSTWGSAASPLLFENLVILIHDQNKSAPLCVALDKTTGKLVWQRERPKAMGWCTPVVVRTSQRVELLYAGGETLKGYDPRTGEELWTLSGPTREVVPTVVIGPELVYSASGRQGPTLAVAPGGSGDVTESRVAWTAIRGGPHVPSPTLVGDRLFVVNDFGIASCLNAQTGEFLWQDRIRDKFSASGVEAGGHLYFPSETGVTYVLKAADQFEIVAQNDLGAPILASPAALAGRLYLRAGRTLYCIGK